MMTGIPFKPPGYHSTSFNCPHCNAYADQDWHAITSPRINGIVNNVELCICSHCRKKSIWHNKIMIHPDYAGIESPNEDLDEEIKADYNEAASIMQKSPRGSAALLRLAVQKLCKQLGEPGKDINTDIGNLVKKGLSPTIQQALDALRVIGNESVHPGQVDLRDDPTTAQALFRLLNKISETMITEPRQIQAIYDSLPEQKKKAIEDRDRGSS